MGKVWVLDTETKGTGANMVPLDRILRKPGSDLVPGFVFPKLKPPAAPSDQPKAPRRFKVVDVLTREVLADEADARTTIEVLGQVRSLVDITLWVWQPERERWRMLTLDEARTLWEYRGRLEARGAAAPSAPQDAPA